MSRNTLSSLSPQEVKEIRKKLNMSQSQFAKFFHIPISTIHKWEQGIRKPDSTSTAYLRTINLFPDEVRIAQNTDVTNG